MRGEPHSGVLREGESDPQLGQGEQQKSYGDIDIQGRKLIRRAHDEQVLPRHFLHNYFILSCSNKTLRGGALWYRSSQREQLMLTCIGDHSHLTTVPGVRRVKFRFAIFALEPPKDL